MWSALDLRNWTSLVNSSLRPSMVQESAARVDRHEGSRPRLPVRASSLQILKAGILYFVAVFGSGFVLGIIRTLWIVPRFGTRKAELMEAPIMFVIIVVAARWVALRPGLRASPLARLAAGLFALGLLLLSEFTVVLWIRGLTIADYLASRDPVAGAVYALLLAAFALMPMLVDL